MMLRWPGCTRSALMATETIFMGKGRFARLILAKRRERGNGERTNIMDPYRGHSFHFLHHFAWRQSQAKKSVRSI